MTAHKVPAVSLLLLTLGILAQGATPTSITATGGTPQSAVTGTAFPAALAVTLKDSLGNPVSGVTVTFLAPSDGAGATLSATTATTDELGIASITATANDTAGAYTVTASAGALSASFSLTNTDGSLTATGGAAQATVVGTAFTIPLQVILKDAGGNPRGGVTVAFRAPSEGAGAILSATTAITDDSGAASVALQANHTAGSYRVTASVDDGLSADFSLTNTTTSQAATLTATAGTPQSTAVGTAFASPLKVTARDSGGNPVSGLGVMYAAPVTGAGAVLSSNTAVTDSSGVATITATANATAGSYSVAAISGTLGATFSLSNTSSTPGSVIATGGTPQSTAAGSPFSAPLEVTVRDSGGSPISGVVVLFLTPPAGPSATLSSNTATTDGSGIARVSAVANGIPGSYTAVASVNSLSASFALTNQGGQAASMTATGGTPQSTATSTAFANPLQVTVKDSFGNPVNGISVMFAAPSSGASASLSASSATTNASGLASITATANSIAGNYNVTATAGSLSVSFSLTNTGTTPASMTATGGTPQSAAVGTAFSAPLQVTVRDSGGNPVNGVTVTFAPPPSGAGATLSAATVSTNASGNASVNATANSTAGTYSVTATAGSLSASFSLSNTGTAPASITAAGGTPQSTTVGAPFASQLQALVKDSSGNPISGVTVAFAAPPSGAGAALSSTTATTNGSGIAAVSAVANSTAGSYNVTATVGAFSTSFALTNTGSQAASITATGGTPQSAATGAAFANPLQATVKDGAGNPMSGITVTFAAPPSGAGAILSSTTAVANSSGIASVTATANATPGAYNVTATVGSLSTTFALTNTGGTAASITATGGTPQSAAAGTAFANPLQATVKDANGNPLSGITVAFTAPASGAGAFLQSSTAQTNGSGIASITAGANGTPGSYNVTASITTTAGTLSATFALSNTSSAPTSITATGGTPQSTAAGTAFSTPLQVMVKDAGSNPVAGAIITFAAPTSGASATLSSTTAVTNAAGVASVTATANSAAGTYLVTATTGAFTTTFSLTNVVAANVTVTATLGFSQAAILGTAFSSPLRVMVKDLGGTPVSGVTVNFAAPTTGASATLSSPTAVTDIVGFASVTATANTLAGSYNVTASVGTATATFFLSNVVGPAAIITSTRGTPQSTATGTAFTTPLQALVRDASGNPVPGATVVFAAPTDGASATLSATVVSTNSQGLASVTAVANSIAGSYLVSARMDNLSTLFALTNVNPGAPTNLALGKTASQSSTLAGVASAAASSAVDGNTGGGFYGNSVTATNLENSPWWQVDLGGTATISSVVIFNRTDCCGSRLGDYWLFISNTPFQATDTPAILQGRTGTFASHQTTAPSPSTTIDTGGAQGRYVRIQLTGSDYLSLAEVQVMGTGGGSAGTNLAAGKSASQSSTLAGYATAGAASAVDGNPDGAFFNGSVTATNLEASPWWQVDLGASASIDTVTIFNRTDCCGSRLTDYWVFVSDTPFLATDTPATLQNRAGTVASHQTIATPSITIHLSAQGRYVRIQLTGTDYLSLAEVQVFGTAGSTPGDSNVSQGKTASQSSTLPGYLGAAPASAVDGSTDGSFYNNSVSTTDLENSPWWQVDLGASKSVSSVIVWNRTDCCGSRLNDYWVFVSDTPFLATDTPATLQSRAGTVASHQTTAPAPSTAISVGAQGRYVRVQLSGQNYLSLAEVQVMGQ